MLYSNEDDDGEDYHQCDVYARHSIDTTLRTGTRARAYESTKQ